MTETTTTEYRIGHIRLKYLDLANICFAQENYPIAEGYIDDFLATIDENSETGQLLKTEFDRVSKIKKDNLQILKDKVQSLSYLKKKDIADKGYDEIEINFIHDKKEICWSIAMQKGLFYE